MESISRVIIYDYWLVVLSLWHVSLLAGDNHLINIASVSVPLLVHYPEMQGERCPQRFYFKCRAQVASSGFASSAGHTLPAAVYCDVHGHKVPSALLFEMQV